MTELDDNINRALALLERCFHLVLHFGMDTEAFSDYKQCQEILQLIANRSECAEAMKEKIYAQLARFDWDALNSEIKMRAEFV
jgi:hypothetical protein